MEVVLAWEEEGMRLLFTSEEEGKGLERCLSYYEEEVADWRLSSMTREATGGIGAAAGAARGRR
jgi:hypothetical protein